MSSPVVTSASLIGPEVLVNQHTVATRTLRGDIFTVPQRGGVGYDSADSKIKTVVTPRTHRERSIPSSALVADEFPRKIVVPLSERVTSSNSFRHYNRGRFH